MSQLLALQHQERYRQQINNRQRSQIRGNELQCHINSYHNHNAESMWQKIPTNEGSTQSLAFAMGSTWQEQLQQHPNVTSQNSSFFTTSPAVNMPNNLAKISTPTSVDSTWHPSENQLNNNSSLFGPAPIVRNPSKMSSSEFTKPLSVDVSVEYELPESLKISTKDGPSLLMIQNQRTKNTQNSYQHARADSIHSGQLHSSQLAWIDSTRQKLVPSVLPGKNISIPHGNVTASNSWRMASGENAWVGGGSVPKLARSSGMNQSHSVIQELTEKVTLKRKYAEMTSQDLDIKRQKLMALTPPDLMSAANFLESSGQMIPAAPVIQSNMFHRSSMFQRSPLMFQDGSLFPGTTRSLYPVQEQGLYGYTSMFPQLRQNARCPGCTQGICRRI
jgi:hypothetical protein